MCFNLEPAWYKDDEAEVVDDVLYFGCREDPIEETWFGLIQPEGDGWRWKIRLTGLNPQCLTGVANDQDVVREIVEEFHSADELAISSCGSVELCDADGQEKAPA